MALAASVTWPDSPGSPAHRPCQVALAACATWTSLVYRRAMSRPALGPLAFATAAAVLGLMADTGPLFPGLAALVVAGLALHARSAQYIVVWAVAPMLVWATYGDLAALAGTLALACRRALRAARGARARTGRDDAVIAGRITLAAAMVLTASALLSFDLLLR